MRSNAAIGAPPFMIEKTEIAAMIQMKPRMAQKTTQTTSTTIFRMEDIDPRPIARISIECPAPLRSRLYLASGELVWRDGFGPYRKTIWPSTQADERTQLRQCLQAVNDASFRPDASSPRPTTRAR